MRGLYVLRYSQAGSTATVLQELGIHCVRV
jgi:hypothetical protein